MYDPNDNPHLKVYPELNVFELPLTTLMLLSLIIAIPLMLWNGLYHLMQLVGVSLGFDTVIFSKMLSEETLTDPVLGTLVSIGVIIGVVFYTYFCVIFLKGRYSKVQKYMSRLKTLSLVDWSANRVRRSIAHFGYGFSMLIFMFMFWLIWASYLFRADSLFISFGIFIVGFMLVVGLGSALSSTETGHNIVEWYFRVIGGYEDGSVGRRLHIMYKDLEETLTREEAESLMSKELFEKVVDVSKFEEE